MKKLTLLFTLLCLSHFLSGGTKETDLFADGTFSLWTKVNGEPVESGWNINNGIVECEGTHTGDIITKAHYREFELTFDWKVSMVGNSGVKYRTKGILGLEYQIIDAQRHEDGKLPSHRSASLFDLKAAPDDKPINPVGEWNKGKIIVKGNTLEHWLNGEKVVELEIGTDDWKQRLAASKYAKHEDFGTWTGPILLQDHGDKVWFRNVKIKRL